MAEGRKPPPDHPGNLHGRMLVLRTLARQRAEGDVREGEEPPKALARRLKEIEPQLADLRRRLQRVAEDQESDSLIDVLSSL